MNDIHILKEFNIEATSQWIFYDDRFQNFFDHLTNNITRENLLNEDETLEYDELILHKKIYGSDEKNIIMCDLDTAYPALFTVTAAQVKKLQQNISIKEKVLNGYGELITEMRGTKSELDEEIQNLSGTYKTLETHEFKTYSLCLDKAMKLEQFQDNNYTKFTDVNKLFSKAQLWPLFMHQIPLDRYFLKCDSFLEYVSLYLKNYFNIVDYDDSSDRLNFSLEEKAQFLGRLERLDNLDLILRAIVYDGSVDTPTIDNVRNLKPVFDAKIQQEHFDEEFRNIREQFSKNISERMRKDPLWRSQHMLWIWFLTEPNKILDAIEEVKKAASKAPQMRSFGGIIRKKK